MVLLIMVALTLMVLLFYEKLDIRESFVCGVTAFGTTLLLITELLSCGSLLTFTGVFMSWLTVILVLTMQLSRATNRSALAGKLFGEFAAGRQVWFSLAILFILTVTLVIALMAAPNNYDSMTYHMSRVAYWMQHRTVAHFPTHNTRQIFMSPWAEYAILHLQILAFGSDRFANLVQWGAFLGTMIVASLLAAQMGGTKFAQWLAALLVASTPMAILQATSTQTDLICSFWVLAFVWITTKLVDADVSPTAQWVLAGLTLGLAIATKGTAYIFCAPFVARLLWSALVRRNSGASLRGSAIMLGLVMALNAPHYLRNVRTFGTPLGDPAQMQMLNNTTHSPAIVLSNAIRNLSLHLQTPFLSVNEKIEQAVNGMHDILGLDPSDPGSTWGGRYYLSTSSFHEDYGGNVLLFCLMMASGMLLVTVKGPRIFVWYLSCAAAGFILFCFMLKWQLWGSRLQLPFFMILTPVCSLIFSDLSAAARKFAGPLAIICALSAQYWIFNNTSRPLLLTEQNRTKNILINPRLPQYFNNRRALEVPLYYAMAKINSLGCDRLGLVLNMNSLEYPLVPIQKDIAPERNMLLQHIFVDNPSSRLASTSADICAILTIDQKPSWQPAEPYASWKAVYRRDTVQVFAP